MEKILIENPGFENSLEGWFEEWFEEFFQINKPQLLIEVSTKEGSICHSQQMPYTVEQIQKNGDNE